MLVLILASAFIFMKFMAVSRQPDLLAGSIGGLPLPPIVILLLIVLLYIVLGMFLDGPSAIVLTLPVLFPVIISDLAELLRPPPGPWANLSALLL